ncbi:uncharacterized protein I303_107188 [Kwoniella dejecticola CBS 10117]|uniref:Integral membrane protein n=1 Tax=Kwoniella dejecticola CBS 10117 TaxID=1296121 RepID=A0A1A5ZZ13_9TREE|nr:uncharacterized protein I303_06589 [Kwoniella dejecticola CBS 10117]OBR83030.1 integral membrane protein [Kwoniella dejecticola CBS 10117]
MRFLTSSFFLLPLITLLSLISPVSAKGGDTLYTNSVTYCAEAKAVLVNQFDIAYHKSNGSITFSFSLASVEPNLNVSANLYVNVYGIEPVNQTLNLCDYFQGVVCPLPQVNFTGYGTYPIPTKYSSQIPGIAWSIPNLEAYARIQLLREETGEVAACLQATLSNGWSVRQTAVSWATGIFTLVALLIGLFHTGAVNSPSPAQYRWFDILYLFQSAAASGLMHLNYPLAYSAFTQNFHWAIGLFKSTHVQNSINTMRSKTGGHLDSNAYSDVQYINRKFSPYNVYVSMNEVTSSKASFQSFLANAQAEASNLPTLPASTGDALASHLELGKRASIASALAQNATSELSSGLPVYTNTLNIPTANAFDTVFFFFLAFIAIAIAFHVLLFVVLCIVDRSSRGKREISWAGRLRRMWWGFCAGNALRLCLIWFFPIFIFGFWQFHIGDSGLSIFFAVFSILLVLVPLATVFVLSILRNRKMSSTAPGISPLYTSYRWFHSVGVLYRAYRQKFHFFWFAPLILGIIARSAFIAFGPTSAWAQVIGNVVVEFIVFVSLLACRPHKDRKGDWITSVLSLFRLIAFGLLIAFIPSIGVKPIPRAVIGFVIIVAFGLPTILLFFGMLWNLGYGYWWRRHTHRIEDGLEVERFVASDDDSSVQPAMTQLEPTLPNVASRDQALNTSRSPAESLNRRTSIMEPVASSYYEPTFGSKHLPSFNGSASEYENGSPPNRISSDLNNSNNSNFAINGESSQGSQRLSAAQAYEQAAQGGEYNYNDESKPQYQQQLRQEAPMMTRQSTASSRPLSGHSNYYTPSTGLYDQDEKRRSGDQYFGNNNNQR